MLWTLAVSKAQMSDLGIYFDGTSSTRRSVVVSFEGAIVLRSETGDVVARWPYGDIRREDSPATRLRLSCLSADPLARLELTSPDLIARCETSCSNLDRRHRTGATARIAAWSFAAATSLLLVGWFGIPLLAERLAGLVPASLERRLGDAVDEQLRTLIAAMGDGPLSCEDDPLHEKAQAILAKFAGTLDVSVAEGVKPRIAVLRTVIPNAVALPGGQIYVFSPLLRSLATSDEFASVLTHEMGHVTHRHGLQRFFEESGLAILFGYMVGDFAGGTLTLAAGRMLTSASFSREMEQAADDFSAQFMQRHERDPGALASALERIAPSSEQETRFAYLQSHPLTEDRARFLRARSQPAKGKPLIDDADWLLLKRYCRSGSSTEDQ